MTDAKNEGYLGNTFIKKAGVEHQYTEEELNEYLKCSKDPVHFIENYCQVISLDEGMVKFKLRGYQDRLIKHYDANRFNVVLASRQSGKSITSCAYLIWYLTISSRSHCSNPRQQGCNRTRDDFSYSYYVRVSSLLLTAWS